MNMPITQPKPGSARLPHGEELLHDPLLNKGTAFTEAERAALGLRGLLPPHVHTLEEQAARVMDNYRNKQTDLERYIHLVSLQDRNETLFYKVVGDRIEEMMPIIYTPTVGQACQQWGHLFRRPRGLYVSWNDRGSMAELLRNWPGRDVRVIVVTDGERILGLGDQGVGGMGIPVGKLSLYTACAGIDPATTLPVMLDVGTENQGYLADPLYLGLRQKRIRGAAFDAFVAEFITAVNQVHPRALIQFEDFANVNAFRLLSQWRDKVCTFNDDIQGTAAVTLAGLYSTLRITGKKLRDQKLLFLGAGEAGVGIGDLIASAMVDEGATLEEARRRCWFVDTQGLVVKSRSGLAEHKLRFAHDGPAAPDFLSAIQALEPTAIIGVSTQARAFGQPDRRGHEPPQRPAGHLRALQPDLEVGVHRRGGLPLVEREGHLRQRQPVPALRGERQDLRLRPGEQLLHLPRRRAGRGGHPGPPRHRPDVRGGGPQPGGAGAARRPGDGADLPLADAHPRGLGRHRRGRRRGGLRDRAGAGGAARRHHGAHQGDHVGAEVPRLRVSGQGGLSRSSWRADAASAPAAVRCTLGPSW